MTCLRKTSASPLLRSTPPSARTSTDNCRRSPWSRRRMVFENTNEFPTPEGAQRRCPAAQLDLRLPEAGHRILHAGRVGAVQAALHHCAAVQLRRHRREARAERSRHHERQRETGDVARRARSRAENFEGSGSRCTSSAPATRSATIPMAAIWRRASASASNTRRQPTTTSTCRRQCAPPCWNWLR